jgi:hypothetical protein
MLPSEYFKRQCYIALDVDEEPAVDVVEKVGPDFFVVSTDYPHSDGAFPEAMAQFFGLPFRDEVRRKILWDKLRAALRDRHAARRPHAGRAGRHGGHGLARVIPERTRRPRRGSRPVADWRGPWRTRRCR